MLRSQLDKVTALTYLNSDEEKIFQQILVNLHPANSEAKTKMIETLSTYPLRLLYAFSEKSPKINELLETDSSLNESWAYRLENMEYPYHRIQAFNKKSGISLFSQMKGAHLLDILDKNPDGLHRPDLFAILAKACDLGMYQALIMRLNFYSAKLLDKDERKKNPDTMDNYAQLMLMDVDKLNNLYWAIGCIDSSLILFNIINYYFELPNYKPHINQFFMFGKNNQSSDQFSWMNKYDDNRRPYPIAILEVAVENLYLARLLAEFPESKKISDQISHGEGLLVSLGESFSSYQELENRIKEELTSLHVPLIETFCRQAYKHAVKTIHKQYPDYVMPEEPEQLKKPS